MRTVGIGIFAFGATWFVVACLVMCSMLAIETFTGDIVELPSAGHIEWAGLLVFLGMYLGSWVVMSFGAGLFLIDALMRHRSAGSRSNPPWFVVACLMMVLIITFETIAKLVFELPQVGHIEWLEDTVLIGAHLGKLIAIVYIWYRAALFLIDAFNRCRSASSRSNRS